MTFKSAMNGAPIPNWAKILALGLALGFQVAVTLISKSNTVNDVRTQQKIETLELKDKLDDIDDKIDRRTRQINSELKKISTVTKYIASEVD